MLLLKSFCHSYDDVEDLSKAIIKKYVCFDPMNRISRDDKVHLYATQLMTLLLFWYMFNDAMDGDRIIDYWKFFLVIIQVEGHRNYYKEAIMMSQSAACPFTKSKGLIKYKY